MRDAPSAEQSTTTFKAVAPVGEQMSRSFTRPTPRAFRGWYAHRIEQSLKLGAAMTLTRSEHYRQRTTLAVTGQVQLGRETSSAASQSLIFGV